MGLNNQNRLYMPNTTGYKGIVFIFGKATLYAL